MYFHIAGGKSVWESLSRLKRSSSGARTLEASQTRSWPGGNSVSADGVPATTAAVTLASCSALGTTVEVPTFDGSVPLEIPAGTQPGEQIVMRGRGMPPLSRGRTGDLRVVVNVAIPRRLTREQRDLLERFADTITDDNSRSDEGMLAKLKRVLAG